MIGERLKHLRKENHLSQKELAILLGTSQGYISDIEKDLKKPGTEFLLSLKRFLGVNLDWFLTGEGDVFAPRGFLIAEAQDVNYRNASTAGKIAKIVEGLDEEARHKVLVYAEEQKLLRQVKQRILDDKKKGGV